MNTCVCVSSCSVIVKNKETGPASALQLYYIFCDDNKIQRGLRHQPSTYMYECLL